MPPLAETIAAKWVELGPKRLTHNLVASGINAGRVTSILLLKSQGRMIAGTASGGLWWRPLAGPGGWLPASDYAPSLSIGALASDPSQPRVLYAGTGEPSIFPEILTGEGILKSVDAGETWKPVDSRTPSGEKLFVGKKICRIWVHPRDSSLLVSSQGQGLFRSSDGGSTFRRILSGGGIDFAVDPTDPDRILFSDTVPEGRTWRGGTLWLSKNGGQHFARVDAPWQRGEEPIGRIDMCFAPGNPRIVWASVAPVPGEQSPYRSAGLYRSQDGGETFHREYAGTEYGQSWYCNVIRVDPSNPDRVYLGGVDFHTFQRGQSAPEWLTYFRKDPHLPFVHADQHALVFDPADSGVMFAGNDGGVFVTRDRGNTWTDFNLGLHAIQFYSAAVSEDGKVLIGGTQDNGITLYRASGDWHEVVAGDGSQCAVSPDGTIFASGYDSAYYVSTDAGKSFVRACDPPTLVGEFLPFLPPLVMHPRSPRDMFGGASRVYRGFRTDAGELDWTPLSAEALFEEETVARVAVAASRPEVIYASGGGFLRRTATGGGNWEYRSPPGGQAITGLAVHPENPDYLVCTRSGYLGGQVMRTADGGRTWKNITENLPNVPVNHLVMRLEKLAGRLDTYLATDTGVYYADINATAIHWLPLAENLPHVVVFDVLLSNGGTKLYAVTHGRGIWQLSRPATVGTIQSRLLRRRIERLERDSPPSLRPSAERLR